MYGSTIVVAASLAGTALATALTTVQPCTQKKGLYPDQTITAQFQPVSYCVPTVTTGYSTETIAQYGTTQTKVHTTTGTDYPLASTSTYVSTVIPCEYDGHKAAASCTVTTMNQNVECRKTSMTTTSYETVKTTTVVPVTATGKWEAWGNGTHHNATTSMSTKTITQTKTHHTTVSKHYDAPYGHHADWIVPGYGGCPVCPDCGADSEGNKYQTFNVTDCSKTDDAAQKCSTYVEVWTSTKAPTSTSVTKYPISTSTAIPSGGEYTFTFTGSCPSTTYTAPGTSGSPSTTITAPAQTWTNTVTTSFSGPTSFYYTSTITKTVTYSCPYKPTGGHPTSTGGYGQYPTSNGGSGGGAYPTSNGGNGGGSYTSGNGNGGGSYTTSNGNGGGAYPTTSGGNGGGGYTTAPTSTYPGGNPNCPTDYPKDFKLKIVEVGARFQKNRYVGFEGDDAVVSEHGSCAKFNFDGESNLKTEDQFISTEGSSTYTPFERVSNQPGSYTKFSAGSDGFLALSGASKFCLLKDAILIVYGSSPSGCTEIKLQKEATYTLPKSCQTTTTTTTTTTTSLTTSETTSTTTTTDASAGNDYEDYPTPTPEPTYGYKVFRRAE